MHAAKIRSRHITHPKCGMAMTNIPIKMLVIIRFWDREHECLQSSNDETLIHFLARDV